MSNPKVAHPPTKAKPKAGQYVEIHRERVKRMAYTICVAADAIVGVGHILRGANEAKDAIGIACVLELPSKSLFRASAELDAAIHQPAPAGGAK